MSGIVGSYFNTRGSGVVAKLGTDGQVFTSSGAGVSQAFEAAAGGGKIVQVVQTYKTDVTTQAGSAPDVFFDISGMSQAITPTKAGSKILVDVCLVVGALDLGTTKVQADIDGGGYNDIGLADESSNRSRGFTGAV